jgi:hypothetical protein
VIKKSYTKTKTSILWKIPIDDLREKVASYTALGQILRDYGLENKGRNSSTLKRRLSADGIDFSHFRMGIGSNKGRTFKKCKMTLEECCRVVFIENSKFNRSSVKRYLKRFDLKPYVCECGQFPMWNGKPLVLQLDHKNGISNDHRLENIQWICPNCHTQTSTFAGKQKSRFL